MWSETRMPSLAFTLFYVHKRFASELEKLKVGVHVGDKQIHMLMYADDLVLLSGSPQGLQAMASQLYE